MSCARCGTAKRALFKITDVQMLSLGKPDISGKYKGEQLCMLCIIEDTAANKKAQTAARSQVPAK